MLTVKRNLFVPRLGTTSRGLTTVSFSPGGKLGHGILCQHLCNRTRDELVVLQRGLRVIHFPRGRGCRGPEQRVAVLYLLHHNRAAHEGTPKLMATCHAAGGYLSMTRGRPRDVLHFILLIDPVAPYPYAADASKCPLA